MQTPAEKYLVEQLALLINNSAGHSSQYRILNIGAGESVAIERQLTLEGCRFVSDRVDVDNCLVDFPAVGHCWQCSVDRMQPVGSGQYPAAFANYVLEHVKDLEGAIQEIGRVLAPGGVFIAAVPNPSAVEFIVSKHSPLWFHKKVRGGEAWETEYAYKNIPGMLELFRRYGFAVEEVRYWPFIEQYLSKYPILNVMGRLYDRLITFMRANRLMGNVCIVVKKPRQGSSL